VRLFRRGESASTLDLLIAGLGNPGPRHERDRHNIGWMVVEELARRSDASFKSKFNGKIGETRLGDCRLALLKPETYMNESGRSISAAARYFKVVPADVLVVHDDVDLELGRLQARAGGGLAGHNGLRSIAQALGTPEFVRLRIGVGRPGRGDPRNVADYVLAAFEAHEDRDGLVGRAADAVESLVLEGLEEAQRRFN
jgi:peptidyl-tRNA hydrolase, PTH1 family